MSQIKTLAGENELRAVANLIANAIRKHNVLTRDDIDPFFRNLSSADIEQVINLLKSMNCFNIDQDIFMFEKIDPSILPNTQNLAKSFIRPEYLNTDKDHIQVGNNYYVACIITGYPSSVEVNWLSNLVQEKSDINFSIHAKPYPPEILEKDLTKKLKDINAQKFMYEQANEINPSLDIRADEVRSQITAVAQGKYTLFLVNIYFIASGSSPDEARTRAENTMARLRSIGIQSKIDSYYQFRDLRSTLPVGKDFNPQYAQLLPGDAVAAMFPFSTPFFDIEDKDSILFGFNDRDLPVGRNIWAQKSYSGLILGATGAGKSYAVKTVAQTEHASNQTDVIFLDPQNEYKGICMANNGVHVSLDSESKTIPNVLAFYGSRFEDKLTSLTQVFRLLLGDITPAQTPLLEKALLETYSRKGVHAKMSPEELSKVDSPTLGDLYKVMVELRTEAEAHGRKIEAGSWEPMINRLFRFVHGIYKFMDQKGDLLQTSAGFVVFEFKSAPEEVKPLLMYLILEYIKQRVMLNFDKKIIIIDEAWMLLKDSALSKYLELFIRTIRKFGGGIILVTQSVGELSGCEEGKTILANTMFKLVLATEQVYLSETAKLFQLNEVERDLILTAGKGEGVLVFNGRHTRIKIKASKKIHSLITTNPQELKKLQNPKKDDFKGSFEEKKQLLPEDLHMVDKVNFDRLSYPGSVLSDDQKKELLYSKDDSPGKYVVYRNPGLSGTDNEECLIKVKAGFGPDQVALIAETLGFIDLRARSMGVVVKTEFPFDSLNPHIILHYDGEDYAFEFVNSEVVGREGWLSKKVDQLSQKYPDRLFVVSTTSDSSVLNAIKGVADPLTRVKITELIKDIIR